MEEYTIGQIIFAGLAAVGGIAGIFKGVEVVSKLIDKHKQGRAKAVAQRLADNVELRRLEVEADAADEEAIKKALWEIIAEKKAEIEDLKETIEEKERTHSLSRTIVTSIHGAVRELKRELDVLDRHVLKQTPHDELAEAVERLREALGRLEECLP